MNTAWIKCVVIFVLTGYGRFVFFFFSSRRRHTRCSRDWSSDVCSSDLFIAIDPARFRPLADFKRDMDDFFDSLKATPTAEGHDRVYVAGEPEAECEARRRREGIPLSPGLDRARGRAGPHSGPAPARLTRSRFERRLRRRSDLTEAPAVYRWGVLGGAAARSPPRSAAHACSPPRALARTAHSAAAAKRTLKKASEPTQGPARSAAPKSPTLKIGRAHV